MNNEKLASVADYSLFGYFIMCITQKYFCFKGRARRKEYWSFVLFNFLIGLALGFLGGDALGNYTRIIVKLALLIPGLAVLFRRLHDVNFSGWWAIWPSLGMMVSAFIFAFNKVMQRTADTTTDFSVTMIIASVIALICIIGLIISLFKC